MVLGSDGPFPSASTAHMYTIRQASTRHWYYNLSLNTRLRLLLNGRAQTEPWQCQLQKQTVFLFTPPSSRCLGASGQTSSRYSRLFFHRFSLNSRQSKLKKFAKLKDFSPKTRIFLLNSREIPNFPHQNERIFLLNSRISLLNSRFWKFCY